MIHTYGPSIKIKTYIYQLIKTSRLSHEFSSIGGHLHYYAGDRGSNPIISFIHLKGEISNY
jgi:hypothetical protein